MKALVYYKATVSFPVEVEVPDDWDREEFTDAKEVACDLADREVDYPTLCYHCSRRLDLSDFEIDDEVDFID
jgi:hypothetical protein